MRAPVRSLWSGSITTEITDNAFSAVARRISHFQSGRKYGQISMDFVVHSRELLPHILSQVNGTAKGLMPSAFAATYMRGAIQPEAGLHDGVHAAQLLPSPYRIPSSEPG